jgi:hypothetical protein
LLNGYKVVILKVEKILGDWMHSSMDVLNIFEPPFTNDRRS